MKVSSTVSAVQLALRELTGIEMKAGEVAQHLRSPKGFRPTLEQAEVASAILWSKHKKVLGTGASLRLLANIFSPKFVRELQAHPFAPRTFSFDKNYYPVMHDGV